MVHTVKWGLSIQVESREVFTPLYSFSVRLRQSTPSYLQVSIPYSYYPNISGLTSGLITIYKSINSSSYFKYMYVDLETITPYIGSENKSVSITGHKTITFPSDYVRIDGIEYQSLDSDGNQVIRCSPYYTIKPNCSIYAMGKIFTVGSVMLSVSPSTYTHEIVEG